MGHCRVEDSLLVFFLFAEFAARVCRPVFTESWLGSVFMPAVVFFLFVFFVVLSFESSSSRSESAAFLLLG